MQLQFRTEEAIEPKKPKDKKQKPNTAEIVMQLMGFDPGICPKCKKGRMLVLAELPRIRAPTANLPAILLSKLL